MELEALSSPLPPTTTSDPEVAERRRERARALIEARLAEKQASAASEGDGANTPGEPTPQRVGTPVVGTPTRRRRKERRLFSGAWHVERES